MLRAHRRLKTVLATAGALFMLSSSAHANHHTVTITLNPTTANSMADITSFVDFDGDEAASMEIQVADGWLIAQTSGTSPFSDNPEDEEVIGSGTATALWWHSLCTQQNLSLTVTWETSVDAGAPANTVGQATVEAAGGIFQTPVYIVRNGANDYDLEIPDMPDEAVCSSTTDGLVTLLIDGETAGGDDVAQNPSTTGSKQHTVIYTDTGSTTHTLNASTTIT